MRTLVKVGGGLLVVLGIVGWWRGAWFPPTSPPEELAAGTLAWPSAAAEALEPAFEVLPYDEHRSRLVTEAARQAAAATGIEPPPLTVLTGGDHGIATPSSAPGESSRSPAPGTSPIPEPYASHPVTLFVDELVRRQAADVPLSVEETRRFRDRFVELAAAAVHGEMAAEAWRNAGELSLRLDELDNALQYLRACVDEPDAEPTNRIMALGSLASLEASHRAEPLKGLRTLIAKEEQIHALPPPLFENWSIELPWIALSKARMVDSAVRRGADRLELAAEGYSAAEFRGTALELAPDDMDLSGLVRALARSLVQEGRHNEAVAVYDQLLEYPQSHWPATTIWMWRAQALHPDRGRAFIAELEAGERRLLGDDGSSGLSLAIARAYLELGEGQPFIDRIDPIVIAPSPAEQAWLAANSGLRASLLHELVDAATRPDVMDAERAEFYGAILRSEHPESLLSR